MPCGGITPWSPLDRLERPNPDEGTPHTGVCWVCNKPGAQHFCDEWDTYIHARCVPYFLETREGQVVIEHEHDVYLKFNVESEKNVK